MNTFYWGFVPSFELVPTLTLELTTTMTAYFNFDLTLAQAFRTF